MRLLAYSDEGYAMLRWQIVFFLLSAWLHLINNNCSSVNYKTALIFILTVLAH